MIGRRDINKGQLNFYSLEKEVTIGRRMAAEIDRYSKLLDDPAVLELVNRIIQNIVVNSDIKIPLTVKLIDSSDALGGRDAHRPWRMVNAADAGDSYAVTGARRPPALPVADQARDLHRTIYGSRGEMIGMRNVNCPPEDT